MNDELIGPAVYRVPYIVFRDPRTRRESLIADVPRFRPEHVKAAADQLRPLGYRYALWADWIRLVRERLNELNYVFVRSLPALAEPRKQVDHGRDQPRTTERPVLVFDGIFAESRR